MHQLGDYSPFMFRWKLVGLVEVHKGETNDIFEQQHPVQDKQCH